MRTTTTRWALTLITLAALGIDIYVHWDVAHNYIGLPSPSFITEYGLFKFEAGLALVTALLLLARPNRLTAGLAALVLLGGAAALLVYYQFQVGKIGPLPDMSDHTWYPRPEKALSVIAELVGGVVALGLVGALPAKSSARAVLRRTGRTKSAV
jgi:hypothetical protein